MEPELSWNPKLADIVQATIISQITAGKTKGAYFDVSKVADIAAPAIEEEKELTSADRIRMEIARKDEKERKEKAGSKSREADVFRPNSLSYDQVVVDVKRMNSVENQFRIMVLYLQYFERESIKPKFVDQNRKDYVDLYIATTDVVRKLQRPVIEPFKGSKKTVVSTQSNVETAKWILIGVEEFGLVRGSIKTIPLVFGKLSTVHTNGIVIILETQVLSDSTIEKRRLTYPIRGVELVRNHIIIGYLIHCDDLPVENVFKRISLDAFNNAISEWNRITTGDFDVILKNYKMLTESFKIYDTSSRIIAGTNLIEHQLLISPERALPLSPFTESKTVLSNWQTTVTQIFDFGGSVLLVAPTGTGKTVIIGYLIYKGYKILSIVPGDELAYEVAGEYRKYNPNLRVGIITSKTRYLEENFSVLIGTPGEIESYFANAADGGFIPDYSVFDEVHTINESEYRVGASYERLIKNVRSRVVRDRLVKSPIILMSATVSQPEKLVEFASISTGKNLYLVNTDCNLRQLGQQPQYFDGNMIKLGNEIVGIYILSQLNKYTHNVLREYRAENLVRKIDKWFSENEGSLDDREKSLYRKVDNWRDTNEVIASYVRWMEVLGGSDEGIVEFNKISDRPLNIPLGNPVPANPIEKTIIQQRYDFTTGTLTRLNPIRYITKEILDDVVSGRRKFDIPLSSRDLVEIVNLFSTVIPPGLNPNLFFASDDTLPAVITVDQIHQWEYAVRDSILDVYSAAPESILRLISPIRGGPAPSSSVSLPLGGRRSILPIRVNIGHGPHSSFDVKLITEYTSADFYTLLSQMKGNDMLPAIMFSDSEVTAIEMFNRFLLFLETEERIRFPYYSDDLQFQYNARETLKAKIQVAGGRPGDINGGSVNETVVAVVDAGRMAFTKTMEDKYKSYRKGLPVDSIEYKWYTERILEMRELSKSSGSGIGEVSLKTPHPLFSFLPVFATSDDDMENIHGKLTKYYQTSGKISGRNRATLDHIKKVCISGINDLDENMKETERNQIHAYIQSMEADKNAIDSIKSRLGGKDIKEQIRDRRKIASLRSKLNDGVEDIYRMYRGLLQVLSGAAKTVLRDKLERRMKSDISMLSEARTYFERVIRSLRDLNPTPEDKRFILDAGNITLAKMEKRPLVYDEEYVREINSYFGSLDVKKTSSDIVDAIGAVLGEGIKNDGSTKVDSQFMRGIRRGISVYTEHIDIPRQRIVGELFSSKMRKITVMFSDASLALGVNFPIRSSVIIGSPGITKIPTLIVNQMAGRSGRRGEDVEGNIIFMGVDVQSVFSEGYTLITGYRPIDWYTKLPLIFGEDEEIVEKTNNEVTLREVTIPLANDDSLRRLATNMWTNMEEYLRKPDKLYTRTEKIEGVQALWSNLRWIENPVPLETIYHRLSSMKKQQTTLPVVKVAPPPGTPMTAEEKELARAMKRHKDTLSGAIYIEQKAPVETYRGMTQEEIIEILLSIASKDKSLVPLVLGVYQRKRFDEETRKQAVKGVYILGNMIIGIHDTVPEPDTHHLKSTLKNMFNELLKLVRTIEDFK
jgi:hypothetical protein